MEVVVKSKQKKKKTQLDLYDRKIAELKERNSLQENKQQKNLVTSPNNGNSLQASAPPIFDAATETTSLPPGDIMASKPQQDAFPLQSANPDADQLGSENAKVVPEHFYRLCQAKQSMTNVFNVEPIHYPPSAPDLEIVESNNEVVASAPELPSHEDGFDEFKYSNQDFLDLLQGDQLTDKQVDVLFPVEEDWDLGGLSEQMENTQLYPELPVVLSLEDYSNVEPYTCDELKKYYYNPLLSSNESFLKKFFVDATVCDNHFKSLLQNYYQASIRLYKLQKSFQLHKESVDKSIENLFDTFKESITVEAYCDDKRRITEEHEYEACKFNQEKSNVLSHVLAEGRRVCNQDTLTQSYCCRLCKLRCDLYLTDIFQDLKRTRSNFAEKGGKISLELYEESQVKMRSVLNYLFHWVRKNRKLEQVEQDFWSNVENWTSQVIANLRGLDEEDHLGEERFVLNHLLRCPPGFHNWTRGILQITIPQSTTSVVNKRILDNCMYLLMLLLQPASKREEFLEDFQDNIKKDHQKILRTISHDWALIDEYGEDQVASSNMLAEENDLISLFRQIPLEKMISHIFGFTLSQGGYYDYDEVSEKEENFLTTIAKCDVLCQVLGDGLDFLCRPKYKQLVRRIAQCIRNIYLIMTEYWKHYQFHANKSQEHQRKMQRYQLEYDEFCKRCVSRLLSVAKLGIYQFIADLSYNMISQKAAETIYLLMNVPANSRQEVDMLVSTNYTVQEWLDFIQDPDTNLVFEEQLSLMPANEIVYLLTAFANLAQARTQKDSHIVSTIAIDIFKISFVYVSTREICMKTGKELLSTLSCVHPYIISTLLLFATQSFDEVDDVMLYAVNDLPFDKWRPTQVDLQVLKKILFECSYDSAAFKLAKIFIQDLNYGHDFNTKQLVLPSETHREIAFILLEKSLRMHDARKQSNIVGKSFHQVNKMTTAVKLTAEPVEARFEAWVWRVIVRLKLHKRLIYYKGTEVSMLTNNVPCLHIDPLLSNLLRGTSEDHFISYYLAIVLTDVGHSMEAFLTSGLKFLHALSSSGYLEAILISFYCVIPMFCERNFSLTEQPRFVECIHSFLHATDEGIIGHVASYILNNQQQQQQQGGVISSVNLLMSLIQNLVQEERDLLGKEKVVSFWFGMILNIQDWYKDNHLQTLINYLLMCASSIGDKSTMDLKTQLYDNYVTMMLRSKDVTHNTSVSMTQSIVNLMTGSNSNTNTTSFVFNGVSHANVYFQYSAIEVESRYEDDTKLWETLLSVLQKHHKVTIENALRQTFNRLKLNHTPNKNSLSIYRWAQLGSSIETDHPLQMMIWTNFFLRFTYMPTASLGGSMGYRFFEPVDMIGLYNKVRQCMQSLVQLNTEKVTNGNTEEKLNMRKLAGVFASFKLWVEEVRIHEHDLYLPSLPQQYNPQLLAQFRSKNVHRSDTFLSPQLSESLKKLERDWRVLGKRQIKRKQTVYRQKNINYQEKITFLLRQFESPLERNMMKTLQAPISIKHPSNYIKFDDVVNAMDEDIKILSHFAEGCVVTETKHRHFDRDLMVLLPQMYFMKCVEKEVKLKCKSGYPTHKCEGAAIVYVQHKTKARDEFIYDKIMSNRNTYRHSIDKYVEQETCDQLCHASLHLENVFRAMERNLTNPMIDDETKKQIVEDGIRLFYIVSNLYSGERKNCFPVKQLISNCIELLGQSFVSRSRDQASKILDEILSNPDTAVILSPHFSPSSMDNTRTMEYVRMYEKVVKIVSTTTCNNPDVLFVLLTKFDMTTWLKQIQPGYEERLQLIRCVLLGIHSCINEEDKTGPTVTHESGVQEASTHSTVHEIYSSHFTSLLRHSFPQIFIDTLHCVLQASQSRAVTLKIWEQLINVTRDVRHLLDWNCLCLAFDLLSSYFGNVRIHALQTKSDGIYVSWAPYVVPISDLLKILTRQLLSIGISREEDAGWSLVDTTYKIFTPWIQPIISPESGQIDWPWQEAGERTSFFMTSSFEKVLLEFCDEGMTSSVISYAILRYCKLCQEVECEVKEYFHKILWNLPWCQLQPSHTLLDRIASVCERWNSSEMNFVSHVITQVDWMTSSSDDHMTRDYLYSLLRIIMCLGADSERACAMTSLIRDVSGYPWHVIGLDQIEYMSNIFNDRYTWMNTSDQQPISGGCSHVVGFFKQVCRLPLINDDVGVSRLTNHSPVTTTSNSDWSKRIGYLRCIFRMLMKDADKLTSSTSVVTSLLVDLFNSVEMVVKSYVGSDLHQHLVPVMYELFTNMEKLPDEIREIVNNDVMNRTRYCQLEHHLHDSTCQQCQSLHQRALSSITYLASITAICDVNMMNACIMLETLLDGYLTSRCVESIRNGDERKVNWWKEIFESFTEPVWKDDQTFMESCIEGECLLTIHLCNLHHSTVDNEVELANKLTSCLLLLVARRTDEGKLLLIIDDIFSVVTSTKVDKLNSDVICDLISTMEVISQDKIKSGLLGTIGISRQTFRSPEFRLAVKTFTVLLKKYYYESFSVESEDYKQAIEELKQLPSSNKSYQHLHEKISFVSQRLQSGCVDYHEFSRYFVEEFFTKIPFLHHIRMTSQQHQQQS